MGLLNKIFRLTKKIKYKDIEIGEFFVYKKILYVKHQFVAQQVTGHITPFERMFLPITKKFRDNTKVEPR